MAMLRGGGSGSVLFASLTVLAGACFENATRLFRQGRAPSLQMSAIPFDDHLNGKRFDLFVRIVPPRTGVLFWGIMSGLCEDRD
jgi:hypothetical protein